jgi:hypothetical protein
MLLKCVYNCLILKAEYATPFIGLIMVIMTLISIPLMEKRGRRFLHLLGLGGMFVLTLVMTASFVLQSHLDWLKFVSIAAMMLFIVRYLISLLYPHNILILVEMLNTIK